MKRIKVLLLLVVGMLFLAACGGGTGGTAGKLNIALDGVDAAPVTVTDSSGSEQFNDEVDGSVTINLAAGNYTVSGADTDDASAPSSQNVTVSAGQTASVTLKYTVSGGGNGNGNGDGNGDNGAVEAGVYVNVFPFAISDSADVTIYAGDIADDDEVAAASSGDRIELDGGAYTLEVSHEGYTTYTEEFLYEDDTVARFDVTLAKDNSVSGSIARDGVKLGFADEYGAAFHVVSEKNDNKNAVLLASQTEEQVCVTVKLVDGDNNAVSNAPVTVGITNDVLNSTTWYPGACETDSLSGASADKTVYTDGDGQASFVVEATSSAIADFLSEPVKIIASAVGADGVARRAEFKVFFTNMSHLYYGATDGSGNLITSSLEQSEERTGNEFSLDPIVFDETGSNSSFFSTWAYSKQPQNAIRPVGGPADGYLQPNLMTRYPGRVVYTLEDVSTDENGNPLVEFDQCDVHPDALTCVIDNPGSSNGEVELKPTSGVGVEDLPVAATVKATYVFDVNYGNTHEYAFELKDYSFTQEWVGGYLEIDKYVDQHVLTWAGADITLGSQSSTYASDYTSTVYITVWNDSNHPIYDVTIRDGVPGELGVVTDSISDSGTYDASNHTITWSNTEAPELKVLAPGDELTFQFDVYARHKPGYCWDGGDTSRFSAPAQGDEGVQDGDDITCANPYNDPYLVTNGAKPYSVNAAGYLDANHDESSGQALYYYSPEADEADIWVVRPFFLLNKERTSEPVMLEGGAADFKIEARQQKRFGVSNGAYNDLYGLYPWEFDNDDTTAGSGHDADESQPRNNPYARDVQVTDEFDDALDFTSGVDFNGDLIYPSDTKVVGEVITFSPIQDLANDGSLKTATVKLQGNLVSDDGSLTDGPNDPKHDADAEVFHPQWEQPFAAWENCAFLRAPQLNQPRSESPGFSDTIYYDGNVDFNLDPYSGNAYVGATTDEVPLEDEDGEPVLDDNNDPVFVDDHYLSFCDTVAVIPPTPEAFIGINVNGEHLAYVRDDSMGSGDFGDQTNTFTVGESWHYIYRVDNVVTDMAAEDVVLTFEQRNNVTRFTGTTSDVDIYHSNNNSTWTRVTNPSEASVVSVSSTRVEVEIESVERNDYYLVVIPGAALRAGSGEVDYTANYSNNTQQLPFVGPTVDTTEVAP